VTTTNATLEGQWLLKSGVGPQPLPDTKITAEFMDGKLSGKGGCNQYNASFTVEPLDGTSGKIQIQGIASTEMFCGDEINAQESSYFQALEQVREYRLTDEGLVLPYPSPARYLLFTRQ
jgi:heat shock protein HslJ